MSEVEFKKFIINGIDYGQFFETDRLYLFFGNKNFFEENFSFFPSIKFQKLKQIHSNKAVYIEKHSNSVIEADAQYSVQKNLALAIQTADCLPILCFDTKQMWIAAIHAGWKGIESEITKRTIEKMGRSSNAFEFNFFIGPHIQQESFEVDKDVSDRLLACTKPPNEHTAYHIVRDKYFPNLKEIVRNQLQELPIKIQTLQMSKIDTFKDENYSSFRRQKTPCRNWSFIYLK